MDGGMDGDECCWSGSHISQPLRMQKTRCTEVAIGLFSLCLKTSTRRYGHGGMGISISRQIIFSLSNSEVG